MKRDPRHDPRVGDTLTVWGQVFSVYLVTQGLVRANAECGDISYGILRFREWALDATEVVAAPETEAQQRQAQADAEMERWIARGGGLD